MSKNKPLDRRFFLRGVGATMVAVPLLEIMLDQHGEALAQGGDIPKRFVSQFSGMSIGRNTTQLYYPTNTGPNYDLPRALETLEARMVQGDINVISNLGMPFPAEGFHGGSIMPQISGRAGRLAGTAPGPSADQIIASNIGLKNGNNYDPGLILCGQPEPYRGNRNPSMSYGPDRNRIQAEVSPRAAFQNLFGNFTPKNNPDAIRRHAQRISVLDMVKSQYDSFVKTLGQSDQRLMSNHRDLIRDLETKLSAIPEDGLIGQCKAPNDPGADPRKTVQDSESGAVIGYTGENERADVMVDLIHMALTCDLHRTATWMMTRAQSFMNARAISPIQNTNLDVHEQSHSRGTNQRFAYCHRWQVDKFARLVELLKATPEGAGTLLDNTVLVMFHEGGHGAAGPHSTENMAGLIAGGSNFGLKTGEHFRTNGQHPAKLFTTAMKAFGIDPKLGTVSGEIAALFK